MPTFTTSLVLMLSTVTASNPAALATPSIGNSAIVEAASNLVLVADENNVEIALANAEMDPKYVAKIIEEYFKDAPVMQKIAWCESKNKHFNSKTGKVTQGQLTSGDWGAFQINTLVWSETAKKLGIDLSTLKGNMAFARFLYEKYGTQPWYSSQHCWDK